MAVNTAGCAFVCRKTALPPKNLQQEKTEPPKYGNS